MAQPFRDPKSGHYFVSFPYRNARLSPVHALRHTFGTHFSKNGRAPRTVRAAM